MGRNRRFRTGRLGVALATMLSAAVLPAPASAKSDLAQAGSIASISPVVADRGGLVTITGNGFGAQNVRITVDGRAAEVVSATGSKASFRVPALAGPGEVAVTATNPGGHVGTIGLQVRFDGVSTPVLAAAGASGTIGRTGGSLSAGGITLTVPPGALSGDETVTLTRLADLADSPLEGRLIGGVRLEPSGLRFLKPAKLTMALPAGVSAPEVLGFGSASDGTGLHLTPRTVAAGLITIELWHFSTGGASSGGAATAAAMQAHTPSAAEQQAMQRIAAAQPACEAELLAGTQGGPACTNLRQESIRALFDWYTNGVRAALQGAGPATTADANRRFQEWLAWAAQVALVFQNDPPGSGQCGTLQNECDQAHALATTAVGAHAQRRLDRCNGVSLLAELRDVAEIADFAELGAIDLTSLSPPLPDATNGDLLHECAHLDIAVLIFPAVAALLYPNTLQGFVAVEFHNGLARTDVPLTLQIDGSIVPVAADGMFQTTLTPTSAPLSVTMEAEATNPSLQNASFTDTRTLVRPARDRLQLQPLNSTTVAAGGSVSFRVRVAGDGMSGALVAMTVAGPGTIGPTLVTTDPQGEGTAAYTAPASPPTNSATVTASLADGTSAAIPITLNPPITLTVSPTTATLTPGQTQQFTATATPPGTTVTWSASGGTITQSGLYTAGQSTGTFSVTARTSTTPVVVAGATVSIGAPPTVEGRYVGTVCTINDIGEESCSPDFIVDYLCSWQSNLHPGSTCGWGSGQGLQAVPWSIPLCLIETDGTVAGGPFSGKVTSCRFRPASNYAAVRIEGTIGNGRLELTMFAPGYDGVERVWERISMTKVT